MTNIWFEYKYQSTQAILKEIQNNWILEYPIIAITILATVFICTTLLPLISMKMKTNKIEAEKKKRKDKLKYLTLQNEIQTEIEEIFAQEDRKEINEKINRIWN